MNDHADLDLIAAFREGLLDAERGERVGRHLDDCVACADRQAALEEVSSLLAQAPTPAVPQQVTRRLDTALAAEIAAAGETTRAAGNQRAHPRHSSAARGHARRRISAVMLRPLAAAAAGVALVVGGGFLLHSLVSGSTPSSTAGPSAERPGVAGTAVSQGAARATAPRAAGPDLAVLYLSTGTSYQPGRLRAQAANVLQRFASRLSSSAKPGVTHMNSQTATMDGCLRRVSGGRQPLVIDQATYQGRRVNVIIAPASGAAPGHVWVVGLGCSAAVSDIVAQSGL